METVKTLGQLAQDAWFKFNEPNTTDGDWEAAAQAVRAAVIEECAKVCDEKAQQGGNLAHDCSEAIRSLK